MTTPSLGFWSAKVQNNADSSYARLQSEAEQECLMRTELCSLFLKKIFFSSYIIYLSFNYIFSIYIYIYRL